MSNLQHKIGFLLMDSFLVSELAMPYELFSNARSRFGQKLYDICLIGEYSDYQNSVFQVNVDSNLELLDEIDTLFIPAISNYSESASIKLISKIKNLFTSGKRIIASGTGTFILAQSCILDGRKATTHWSKAEELDAKYPNIDVEYDSVYVEGEGYITVAGGTATAELCIGLIRHDWGVDVASSVANMALIHRERRGGQRQIGNMYSKENKFYELLDWLNDNLNHELSTDFLADRLATTPRTLHRQFVKFLGVSPRAYIISARLNKVKALLESTETSIELIAINSGFGSASNLREQFRKKFGMCPKEYRNFALSNNKRKFSELMSD